MILNEFSEYSWKDKKRAKMEKFKTLSIYRDILTSELLTMFEWKNLPESIPAIFLEKILFFNGSAGVSLDEKIAYGGGHSGVVDAYGLGTRYTGATPKRSYDLKIGEGVEVCWNNNIMRPDSYNVLRYAEMFTEIETSMKLAVVNSRHYPIPVAEDTKQQTAINDAIENMRIGKPATIISKNLLSEVLDGKMDIPIVNLSEVDKVDKLQYLSRFKDDWWKSFYNQYGQSLQTTNKLAQQTREEIHGEDSVAFIEPFDRLNQRKEFAEKLNQAWSTDIEVDFSLPWKVEFEKFKNPLATEMNSNQEQSVEQAEGDESKDKEVEE